MSVYHTGQGHCWTALAARIRLNLHKHSLRTTEPYEQWVSIPWQPQKGGSCHSNKGQGSSTFSGHFWPWHECAEQFSIVGWWQANIPTGEQRLNWRKVLRHKPILSFNPDPFEFSLQTWTCDWFTCWQNCAHLTSVVCRCLCPWFYILSRFYIFYSTCFLRAPTFPEPCSPPGLQTNFRLVTDLTRDNKTADSVTTKGWRSTWCTPVSSPLLWESQQQQHMLQRRLTMAPPQTHVDKTETSLCFPVFSHSNITIAEQRSHWVLCEDGREGEVGRGGVSASLFSLISVGTSGSIVCIYFILAKLNQGNLSH